MAKIGATWDQNGSKKGQKCQNRVKIGQNGAKIDQNGAKQAQNRTKEGQMGHNGQKVDFFFRFLDSARNALKWHPNGLKRSKNTFFSKQKGSDLRAQDTISTHFDPILPYSGPIFAHCGPFDPPLSYFEPF